MHEETRVPMPKQTVRPPVTGEDKRTNKENEQTKNIRPPVTGVNKQTNNQTYEQYVL